MDWKPSTWHGGRESGWKPNADRVGALVMVGLCVTLTLGGCSNGGVGATAGRSDGSGLPEAAPVETDVPFSQMTVAESGRARAEAARAAQVGLKDCMDEQGFPGQLLSDGGLSITVAEGQQASYDTALASCEDQQDYGVAEAPLTRAELQWVYDGNVEAFECLKEQGYDPAEPVSFEVFANDYQSESNTAPWSPFRQENGGTLPTTVCHEPDFTDFLDSNGR